MKRVILIGDSIRLHYQPLVAAALTEQAEVWGPVENGGTSANVLGHLREWALGRRPDAVHLNCGLHDLRYDDDATEPQVPLAEYASNLGQVFAQLAALPCPIVWATTTPINQTRHQASRGSRRYEADVDRDNRVASTIAGERGVTINDLNLAVTEAGTDRLLKQDGVHFTEEGYEFLAGRVVERLRQVLATHP
jgi:lysophospholipase L1-like esterase